MTTETRSWINGGFPTYYRIVMKDGVPHLRIFGSTQMFNYPHIVADHPVAQLWTLREVNLDVISLAVWIITSASCSRVVPR